MKRRTSANKTAPVPVADVPVAKAKEQFHFRTTVWEGTYLRVGDVFMFAGRDHVVASVNPSCARIIPITEGTPKTITIKPRFADKAVTFTAPERNSAVSISSNSEVDIKRRLGVNWRERLSVPS